MYISNFSSGISMGFLSFCRSSKGTRIFVGKWGNFFKLFLASKASTHNYLTKKGKVNCPTWLKQSFLPYNRHCIGLFVLPSWFPCLLNNFTIAGIFLNSFFCYKLCYNHSHGFILCFSIEQLNKNTGFHVTSEYLKLPCIISFF